jgi:hypothetical protein
MWVLWWTKRHWGRFSPITSVSPANHSTNFSIIIITRGWHNRPIGGRSVEWSQMDSTPHYINLISGEFIVKIRRSWKNTSSVFLWCGSHRIEDYASDNPTLPQERFYILYIYYLTANGF